MKRLVVMSMVVSMVVMLVAGCATAPKGPTDEEMISKRMDEGISAMKAKNYAAFDSFVSKSFSSAEIGDKDAFLQLLKSADSMGLAEGLEIDLSQAKTVVKGNTSATGPITVRSNAGSLTITGHGAKENGLWMLTGGEQSY
jgi:hypothetical protein